MFWNQVKKEKKKVEKESWRKKERGEVESREKKKRMEIMAIRVWWRKIKRKEKGKVNVWMIEGKRGII